MMKFNDIVKMVRDSCKNFYKDTNYEGIHKTILECSTQIFIEYLKQENKNEEN